MENAYKMETAVELMAEMSLQHQSKNTFKHTVD